MKSVCILMTMKARGKNKHLTGTSLNLCSVSQDSEKYVEQLLTLFNRFSRLVKEAFQDDPRFLTARDKVSRRCSIGLERHMIAAHCSRLFFAGLQSGRQRCHHLQVRASSEAERVRSSVASCSGGEQEPCLTGSLCFQGGPEDSA